MIKSGNRYIIPHRMMIAQHLLWRCALLVYCMLAKSVALVRRAQLLRKAGASVCLAHTYTYLPAKSRKICICESTRMKAPGVPMNFLQQWISSCDFYIKARFVEWPTDPDRAQIEQLLQSSWSFRLMRSMKDL